MICVAGVCGWFTQGFDTPDLSRRQGDGWIPLPHPAFVLIQLPAAPLPLASCGAGLSTRLRWVLALELRLLICIDGVTALRGRAPKPVAAIPDRHGAGPAAVRHPARRLSRRQLSHGQPLRRHPRANLPDQKAAPDFANVGKRLVKSPKVYFRDTGLLHYFLDIPTPRALDTPPAEV